MLDDWKFYESARPQLCCSTLITYVHWIERAGDIFFLLLLIGVGIWNYYTFIIRNFPAIINDEWRASVAIVVRNGDCCFAKICQVPLGECVSTTLRLCDRRQQEIKGGRVADRAEPLPSAKSNGKWDNLLQKGYKICAISHAFAGTFWLAFVGFVHVRVFFFVQEKKSIIIQIRASEVYRVFANFAQIFGEFPHLFASRCEYFQVRKFSSIFFFWSNCFLLSLFSSEARDGPSHWWINEVNIFLYK